MDLKKISGLDELVKVAEDYDFDYDVPDTDIEEHSRRFHHNIESLGREIVLGLDLDDLAFLGQGEDAAPSDAYLEARAEFEDIIRVEYEDLLSGDPGYDLHEPSEDDIQELINEYFTVPAQDHFKELEQKHHLETTTFSETVRRDFYKAREQGLSVHLQPIDTRTPKNYQVMGLRDDGIIIKNVAMGSDGKNYLLRDEVLDANEDKFRLTTY